MIRNTLPIEHGTMSGYKKHTYRKDPKCQPCWDARAEHMREQRKTESYKQWQQEYYDKNKEAMLKNNLEWRKNNPEKVREYSRRYLDKNIDKINTRRRKNYAENKEIFLAKNNAWRLKNKDWINEYNQKRRRADPERFRGYAREYYQSNREHIRNSLKRRRHNRYGVISVPYSLDQVIDLYGTDCHICGDAIDMALSRKPGIEGWEKALHIDHVIPMVKGGPDTIDNVRPSHAYCNLSKSVKFSGDQK